MKIYSTNYNSFLKYVSSFFTQAFIGSWRLRSLSLLSLLFGFYLASTLTSYLLVLLQHRFSIVLILLIFLEITVRGRNQLIFYKRLLPLRALDNFRIGITYAIVLEAFKLGSWYVWQVLILFRWFIIFFLQRVNKSLSSATQYGFAKR